MALIFFKHFTFYIHIMIKNYFFLFRFLVLREWRVAAPTALAIVSSRQPISVGSVYQKKWRRFECACANQRRTAYRVEPISAFQQAACPPIAYLHDGKDVTYIWTELNSFNYTSLDNNIRDTLKTTLQEEAVTSCSNCKAVKPLKVLQFKVRINMKLPFARCIFLNIGNLPAFF